MSPKIQDYSRASDLDFVGRFDCSGWEILSVCMLGRAALKSATAWSLIGMADWISIESSLLHSDRLVRPCSVIRLL